MRPRSSWVDYVVNWLAILVVGGYMSLFVFVPPWVRSHLDWLLAGSAVTIGHIRMAVPAKLVCSDIVIASQQPESTISVQRLVLTPSWKPWRDGTLWFHAADVQGVWVRCRRTAQGTFIWPSPPALMVTSASPERARPPAASQPTSASSPASAPAAIPRRLVHVDTVHLSDGTLEFIDQKTPRPFRGALTQLSVIGGPFTIPLNNMQHVSLAIQAQVLGAQQRSATMFCSGWVNWHVKGLELACQLDPLQLAAFRPYYERGRAAWVDNATLKATGTFSARNNVLDGRVQLAIGNLSEADLSFLHRMMEELKRSGEEGEPSLTGELQVAGALNDPKGWTVQLAPGNLILKRLLQPLVSYGIDNIPVKLGEQVINVELAPANQAVMSDIEAARKTVTENLQVIAPSGTVTTPQSTSVTPAVAAPAEMPVATQPSVESGSVPSTVTQPESSSAPQAVAPAPASGTSAVSPAPASSPTPPAAAPTVPPDAPPAPQPAH